jgi:filamentous hemagglutinin family protein
MPRRLTKQPNKGYSSPTIWGIAVSLLITHATSSLAQVIPDQTLPTPSTVMSNGLDNAITGGTVRGNILFHSFGQFSIPTHGSAYFNQSPMVQTILSRVTGNSISQIDGLIRTNGMANLFLINPNGIVFGPNARLQIGGSFVASTTSSIQFPDGTEFSATKPLAPPLLTINLTPGLQYGKSDPRATISSKGNLTVGQDLILVADRLDLQGQLQAGRHLILQAQDTVQVRDTLTTPFVAWAGEDLVVRGDGAIDILAFNHPHIPFQSGGNLTLISNHPISADSHFASGGNFSVQNLSGHPKNLMSLYDPVIYSNGNVEFGSYVGAALKVEARGSITATGDITITSPDTSTSIALNEPDATTLRTTPALILRAGVEPFGNTSLPQTTPPFLPFPGTKFSESAGVVMFPATISVAGNITTIANPLFTIPGITIFPSNTGDAIALSASGDITLNGSTTSYAGSTNSGAIAITSNTGAITAKGTIASLSSQANGGNITLNALGNISTGDITSDGAEIRLTSNQGSIDTTPGWLNSGVLPSLLPFSLPNVNFRGFIPLNPVNQGGTVTLNAANNTAVGLINTSGGVGGTSGAISISAGHQISLERSRILSRSETGVGGEIRFTAPMVNFNDSEVISRSSNSAQAGKIEVNASEITLTNQSALRIVNTSDRPTAGISINTGRLTVQSGSSISTSTDSKSPTGSARGGLLQINAAESVWVEGSQGIYPSTLISSSTSPSPAGDIQIRTPWLRLQDGGSIVAAAVSQGGRAGNINIQANQVDILGTSPDQILPSAISVDTLFDTGSAGQLMIHSDWLRVADGGIISASTFNGSPGGNLAITAHQSITLSGTSLDGQINSGIYARSFNNGIAGNITLNTSELQILNGARVSVSSDSQGGDAVGIVSRTNLAIDLLRKAGETIPDLVVTANPNADAGNISITANNLRLNQGQITAVTNSGNGGNLLFQIDQGVLVMRNGSLISTTAGTAQAGGNGGNITINAPFVVGVAKENSDITANAFLGRGGNITITTQGIFGLKFRPRLTPLSDITASSEFGVNGLVTLNILNLDPSSGLVKLPTNFTDPSNHIQDTCRIPATRKNQFVISGRGGLPARPEDQPDDVSLADLGTPVTPNPDQARQLSPSNPPPPSRETPPNSKTVDPEIIVEAQGWIVAPDGVVHLVAFDPPSAINPAGYFSVPCDRSPNP